MHAPLGDDLAVEVRELLDHPVVLEHHGAAFARGQRVVVIGDGIADFVREARGIEFVGHVKAFPSCRIRFALRQRLCDRYDHTQVYYDMEY